jgi:hypothetical protein
MLGRMPSRMPGRMPGRMPKEIKDERMRGRERSIPVITLSPP